MWRKVWLVVAREYITRVRKKSFLVMTLLGPVLMALFYGFILYVSINQDEVDSAKSILVADDSGRFFSQLQSTESLRFEKGELPSVLQQKQMFENNVYAAMLHFFSDSGKMQASLSYQIQPGLRTVEIIRHQINRIARNEALANLGIEKLKLDEINNKTVPLKTVKLTDEGWVSGNAGTASLVGMALAIAIYMFIFIYGVQIMQGVIEEKTNRIVEVLISSLRPFELMLGKITGIAMVGLTQFAIWGIALFLLGGSFSALVAGKIDPNMIQSGSNNPSEILDAMLNLNIPLLAAMFLFYFIGGYLFYGSLFAAIGSAVDNETDKQQFMLPVTLPLIAALMLSQTIILTNPNSPSALWLSLIPFTSPIAMMVRLPFDVPAWQILLSMFLLIAGFVFTTWIASRIYRIGILMYGKKTTWRELSRWLFYKG